MAMDDAIVNVKVKVNSPYTPPGTPPPTPPPSPGTPPGTPPAVQWLPGLLPKPKGWREGGVRLLRSWTDQGEEEFVLVESDSGSDSGNASTSVEETRWDRDPWQPSPPKPLFYGWKLREAKKKYFAGVREANWNYKCCGHSMPEQ